MTFCQASSTCRNLLLVTKSQVLTPQRGGGLARSQRWSIRRSVLALNYASPRRNSRPMRPLTPTNACYWLQIAITALLAWMCACSEPSNDRQPRASGGPERSLPPSKDLAVVVRMHQDYWEAAAAPAPAASYTLVAVPSDRFGALLPSESPNSESLRGRWPPLLLSGEQVRDNPLAICQLDAEGKGTLRAPFGDLLLGIGAWVNEQESSDSNLRVFAWMQWTHRSKGDALSIAWKRESNQLHRSQ